MESSEPGTTTDARADNQTLAAEVMPSKHRSAFTPILNQEQISQINSALSSEYFDPSALVDALKLSPLLADLLRQPAVREGYSLEEHTLMVLGQFEKYFAEIEMPLGISRREMRLMLALHDIGKGLDDDRSTQHAHTAIVMEALHSAGLFGDRTLRLLMIPLSFDPLGKYFYQCVENGPTAEEKLLLAQSIARGKANRLDFDNFVSGVALKEITRIEELANQAAQSISQVIADADLSVEKLLEILEIYYQCDTTAYTFDAHRDWKRSRILNSDDVGNIKFNHEKDLRPTPGLDMQPGDASWQVYARLESSARAGNDASFPISRGYPSLDFLYKLSPGFDPKLIESEELMFIVDLDCGRLRFSDTIEQAYRVLKQKMGIL